MKKRLFGILLSLALMLTMMPVLGLTQPAHATTDPALSITSPAVGQVIGNDGKNYDYSSLPQSVTAVAKIAYVDETNHKGLALAMTDESGTKDWNEADTAASAHTPAFIGGTWKLASKDEWGNMINAAGGFASLRDGFSSVGGTNMKGTSPSFYWSSTPQGANEYYINFISGQWYSASKTTKCCVRACLTFDIVTTYPLWVGGTQVNSANAGNILGDQTASYDAESKTLKLNGYSYRGEGYKNAAIHAEEDLVIETTGTNNVANTSTASGTRAIDVDGNLTFQGSGTLNATGASRSIVANTVTVERGTVTVSGGRYGIYACSGDEGNITINGGVVNASAEIIGLQAAKDVIINNGTVTAIATKTDNNNVAIFAEKNITIEGGNVEARGIVGIQAYENLMIKNGIIRATGKSAGIGGLTVTINNGTIEATATDNVSFGIVGAGDGVTINGGQVTASGSKAGIMGYVKNSIAGTGWTNVEGTEGKETIVVNENPGAELSYKKVQFPTAHTHDFTYSADGATITATCSAEGCPLPPSTQGGSDHVAKLTIAAPKHTTYGDGKEAAAQITDENKIQGDAKVQYQKKTGESSYGDPTTTAPKDAGTYKASITLGSGDNSATAHVVYTIAKADPTANAPSGLTATYGQTLSDMTLTNPQGNTPGTWTWKDPGTTSVGNVGDNTFKANFTPTDAANYKSVEDVDVIITVGKAANPATVTSTASVKVGGSKVDLAQNVNKNGATGAVTYAISGGDQGCSISGSELTSGANTGSVTVNVAVAEDDNYNASAAMPITVTITSKDTQTITADDVTVAYGDTGKKIEASTSGDGALSYEVKAGGEYIDVDKSTGMLTVKKPGSAIVTVTAAETSSYAEAAKDVNVTATKAEPTAAAVTANNRKYDGTKKPLVTVDESILVGGTMQYALGKDAKTAPEEGWSETIPSAAEKGTYYVWYMVKGDANHNDSEPQSVTVTISEKGPEPVDESTITFDLNGGTLNGKTGKVAVKVNNGTVITLPEPTRDGYTFDYWEGSKYNAGDQYTVNGDHTFKAVWKTGAGGNGSKGGSSKKGVNTGDENTLGAWIVLLVAALTGTTGMVFARKRRND